MQNKHNLGDLSIEQLRTRAQSLKQLCLDLDPYSPLKKKTQKELEELGINDTDDPFRLTNTLILCMEDTLEEIMSRQKSEDSAKPTIH